MTRPAWFLADITGTWREEVITDLMQGEENIMFINMKEVTATGIMGEFCASLEQKAPGGKEIIFDFKGVQDVTSKDAEQLMSTCLKLKERGNIIRLKDMSLTVRNQFLLSAINYAAEDIVL